MKTLKLNHHAAELLRNTKEGIVWRLFDDKDLSVNDIVQFIDKVDPQEPQTWKIIGVGRISKIVQKTISDITAEEYHLEGSFRTEQEMLETYKGYYGDQVSTDTPLKIIHFAFTPEQQDYVESGIKNTTPIQEIKLYADGGSRGNPGPSASGFVIMDMINQTVVKKGIYLGITTNNQAEYQAVKLALEEALKLQAQVVHVYLDSLLVVNQMLGIFKVKNRDLWPIHAAIKELVKQFKKVSFTHVPRELNKIADGEVNKALDEALKKR